MDDHRLLGRLDEVLEEPVQNFLAASHRLAASAAHRQVLENLCGIRAPRDTPHLCDRPNNQPLHLCLKCLTKPPQVFGVVIWIRVLRVIPGDVKVLSALRILENACNLAPLEDLKHVLGIDVDLIGARLEVDKLVRLLVVDIYLEVVDLACQTEARVLWVGRLEHPLLDLIFSHCGGQQKITLSFGCFGSWQLCAPTIKCKVM